jgi:hypothetical protein
MLSQHWIASLNRFARNVGMLDRDPSYEDAVPAALQHLMNA